MGSTRAHTVLVAVVFPHLHQVLRADDQRLKQQIVLEDPCECCGHQSLAEADHVANQHAAASIKVMGRDLHHFDKSRMEVNDPNAAPGPWYVTNGLLVEELIAGSIQVGSQSFEPCEPAEEAVAGDPAVVNANAPTYRSFHDWSFPFNQDRASDRRGQIVTTMLSQDGRLADNPNLARYAARIGLYEQQLGHNIPQMFADFFAQRGVISANQRDAIGPVLHDWVYVVGLPLSEPYWVRARIGGVERDVLVQVFERRVLTYTPDNPPAWRVEMGNVGRHYLHWRYGLAP